MTADTDDWNRHWHDYAESASQNPAQAYRRRLVFGALGDGAPPARLVDIGAGTGDHLAEAAAMWPAAEFMGLELSAAGVELGRSKVTRARFIECDLSHPVDPGEYRAWATHAICTEVLEHVDDPVAFLRNASAFLAPGCQLIVTVPGGPRSAFDRHIGHRRHFRARDVRSTLEAAGFSVDRVAGAGFPFFNLYRLVVILRGRRLITDVAAVDDGVPASGLARLVMPVFGVLFRGNLARTRLGWQMVAAAHLPR